MKTEKIDVLLGLQWGDEGKGKVVLKIKSVHIVSIAAAMDTNDK